MMSLALALLFLLADAPAQQSDKIVIKSARIVSDGKQDGSQIPLPLPVETALPKGWTPPVPAGNPGGWVTTGDYPAEALRNERQGTVRFSVEVNAQGRVSQCKVTQSSGSDLLDDKACTLISERAVFTPARDKRGRAVAGTYSNAVRWVIPKEQRRPEQFYFEYAITVEADGSVSRCETVRAEGAPEGFVEHFMASCPGNTKFDDPYRDANGQPVRRRIRNIMQTVVEPAP